MKQAGQVVVFQFPQTNERLGRIKIYQTGSPAFDEKFQAVKKRLIGQ